MDKQEIISFFDQAASDWDARLVTDDRKIDAILAAAGNLKGKNVLDVACGTGVLFPYYVRRDVARVIGVDISPEMARIAAQKLRDSRLKVVCGDIETMPVLQLCDCCVVYNAFPHFVNPEKLAARLAQWVRPGGRLTIAHSMSLQDLRKHHEGRARQVSRQMLTTYAMEALLSPWFAVDTMVSDDEKYIVAGTRR